MVVIPKLLGLLLAQVADAVESLTEGGIIAANYLIVRIFWDVNKPLYIIWKHMQSTSPCLMDAGIHIVAGQIKFTNE